MKTCIVEVHPALVIETSAGCPLPAGSYSAVTCTEPALIGTEVCQKHKDEIFGKYVETFRVEKSDGISRLWMVKYVSGASRGLGYRKHHRALAEADYQARVRRWVRAIERRNHHSCDVCQAEYSPRLERVKCAKECPHNLAAWWCRHHGDAYPLPPED